MAGTRCLVGVLLIALVASAQEARVGDIEEPMPMGTYLQQIHPLVGKLMQSDLPCQICEEVVDLLLNVTTSKETLDGIEQLLLTMCDLIPEAYYKDCREYAKQVPSLIDEYAKRYLDASSDCAFVCNSMGGERAGTPDVMSLMKLMNAIPKKRPYYGDY